MPRNDLQHSDTCTRAIGNGAPAVLYIISIYLLRHQSIPRASPMPLQGCGGLFGLLRRRSGIHAGFGVNSTLLYSAKIQKGAYETLRLCFNTSTSLNIFFFGLHGELSGCRMLVFPSPRGLSARNCPERHPFHFRPRAPSWCLHIAVCAIGDQTLSPGSLPLLACEFTGVTTQCVIKISCAAPRTRKEE